MLTLPGGAGLSPMIGSAHRLADFTLPAGTFKRFDLEHVVRLLLDVLSGLAALHEVVADGEPFVHGGVSPQNIYIDEHGTARLVPLLNIHLRGSLKPEENAYAAPELLLGERTDARADVFSVGVMLWEALSGKRLFPDPLLPGVMARVIGRKVPPLSLPTRLRWAQPLCAIAERAIAAEPAERFGSALELSNAMAAAAAQQLSRVDTDAWQEEAPTPVFHPKLHLATLRGSTPPPAVLTIIPSEATVPSVAASLKPEAPPESLEPFEAFEAPKTGKRGRGALWALAAVALGAACWWLPKSGLAARNFAALSQLLPAPARVVGSPAPAKAVELPKPAPVPSVAVPLTPSLASVADDDAAVVTSAAPSAAAPARPASVRQRHPLAAPKAVPGAGKPKSKSRERGDDYGI